MSTRVRVVAYHGDSGVLYGAPGLQTIEKVFKDLEDFGSQPFLKPWDFISWPRWKRVGWMANKLGNWKFKVFHEPRTTRTKHSAFWLQVKAWGGRVPNKRPVKRAPQPQVQLQRAA